MFADILEQTTVEQVRTSAGIARLRGDHPLLAASPPSNQQILDATKVFYRAHQDLVDTSAANARAVAQQHKSFVTQLNGYKDNFQKKDAPTGAVQLTQSGIFGDSSGDDGGDDCSGLFGDSLCKAKASDLFTTIAVGVSAEVVILVGGMGGLGCAFDIAKRERAKGYGYATGELGLKVAADINVQVAIFNKLPSELNENIFGLTATVGAGLTLTFAPFFTMQEDKPTIFGYSVAVGVGAGAGVAVFGGHIWNFG